MSLRLGNEWRLPGRALKGVSLPKPYYEENGIVIYNADCRDILPHLDPVDLVLTDPPYGAIGKKKVLTTVGGANQ